MPIIRLPVDQYVLLELPLGAHLTRCSESRFELLIPDVRFFWLVLTARIDTEVTVVDGSETHAPHVNIRAYHASVEGDWEGLADLNSRFDFSGITRFTWGMSAAGTPQIESETGVHIRSGLCVARNL